MSTATEPALSTFAASKPSIEMIDVVEPKENVNEIRAIEKSDDRETPIEQSESARESLTLLEQLLVKAEKYTQFLNNKLIKATDAATTTPPQQKRRSSITKESISPAPKKIKSANGKGIKLDVKKEPELDPEQPKNMTGGILRDYQMLGYKWLVGLYENGLNGILADEMGLGKTIQTIGLLAHLRQHGVRGPFLLVVPLSTLPNWVSEIKKWVPDMPVVSYHGTKEARYEIRKNCLHVNRQYKKYSAASHKKWKANAKKKGLLPKCLDERFNKNDPPITVTTYDIVCKDRSELSALKWKYIIVDEGHRLKNHKCKLYRELNILTRGPVLTGGANKLLLTGTPLQNNLTELWSLLHFLMPEIFDNLEFFQQIFALDEAVSSKEKEQEMLEQHRRDNIVSKLHKILAPFMMRRLKVEVEKHLPEKREIVLYCDMQPNQRGMYESIVSGELKRIMKEKNVTLKSKTLNNVVMQLRKCSNHPYLHYEDMDGKQNEHTNSSLITASGKMVMLDYMLRHFQKSGNKVLIFSQFTTMLDIIEDYLQFLRPEFKFCRIDGSTSLEDRRTQMDDFNESLHKKITPEDDYLCFLLSTRAGGVGINLTAADTVIIFDSDWNPHQDSQAQDRVHRIGQTKDVAVYRMISAESVELKILQRANSKRKLERVVCARQARINQPTLHPTSPRHRLNHINESKLGVEELRELLKDDFRGHTESVGVLKDLDKQLKPLLDRKRIFQEDMPNKGDGFEVVQIKATSIIGAVNR